MMFFITDEAKKYIFKNRKRHCNYIHFLSLLVAVVHVLEIEFGEPMCRLSSCGILQKTRI